MEAARDQRILIGRGGLYGNVLRISPPLNIQKSDVDEFIQRLDASFDHVTAPAAAGSVR
jgi:4-aminobutyrate aminotransferase-like enzyme